MIWNQETQSKVHIKTRAIRLIYFKLTSISVTHCIYAITFQFSCDVSTGTCICTEDVQGSSYLYVYLFRQQNYMHLHLNKSGKKHINPHFNVLLKAAKIGQVEQTA